jgi:hypothetical protein
MLHHTFYSPQLLFISQLYLFCPILKFFINHMLKFKNQPCCLKGWSDIALVIIIQLFVPAPEDSYYAVTQDQMHPTHTHHVLYTTSTQHVTSQITVFWVCSDVSKDMLHAYLEWMNLADANAKQTSFRHPPEGTSIFIWSITTYIIKQFNPLAPYLF